MQGASGTSTSSNATLRMINQLIGLREGTPIPLTPTPGNIFFNAGEIRIVVTPIGAEHATDRIGTVNLISTTTSSVLSGGAVTRDYN